MADSSYDYRKLAKERMLWAIKPILGVCIVVWVLHPSTATNKNVSKMMLKGFLVGAFYGLVIYREPIVNLLRRQKLGSTEMKNRVPDEYYVGHIEKVLRGKDEKEV